jgi:hypothetical protein
MFERRLIQNLYFAGLTNDVNCDYAVIMITVLIMTLNSSLNPDSQMISAIIFATICYFISFCFHCSVRRAEIGNKVFR